jgi:hypothetical protein
VSDEVIAKEPGFYTVKEFFETEPDPGCPDRMVHTTSQVRRPKPKFEAEKVATGEWHPGMEVWETSLTAARWPVPFGDHDIDTPHFYPHWEDEAENPGF